MINGLLLVDKQKGPTSHDVVDDVRKIFGTRDVGHAGTLDPMATGLLILMIGNATKLSQFVMDEDKVYVVEILLGTCTDSGDVTGQILEKKDVPEFDSEKISECVQSLTGLLNLPVPKYSAIKIQGKKLYEYARNNEDVAIPVKAMMIKKATVLDLSKESIKVEIHCGKGTYIRSWVEELGRKLGCGATVKELRRTGSGSVTVDQAHGVRGADGALKSKEEMMTAVMPLGKALSSWPALKLIGREQALIKNGQIPKGVFHQLAHVGKIPGLRFLGDSGELLALAVQDEAKGLKLSRVF